jgi:uncharacterized protein (DUF1015 family)
VGALDKVLSPPYDLYSDDLQQAAYDGSPHHFVRVILNREPDPYAAATSTLREWIGQGVLRQDNTPAIYPYSQAYRDPQGSSRLRRGFLALLRLTSLAGGPVYPHERTLPKPLGDRYELLRATHCDLEPVFIIFPDEGARVESLLDQAGGTNPDIDARDADGNVHRVWSQTDHHWQTALVDAMAQTIGVIADGHHRYKAALQYAEDHRKTGAGDDHPANFKLAAFFPASPENLTVFPIHRVVQSWPDAADAKKFFNMSSMSLWTPEDVLKALPRNSRTLGVLSQAEGTEMWAYKPGAALAWAGDFSEAYRALPTALFEAAVLRGILGMTPDDIASQMGLQFVKSPGEAKRLLWNGYQRAFFLPPTPLDAIFATARAGELMPQKSTFFYPKLLSGLVSYLHES